MGTQSIVFGRIVVKNNLDQAREIIVSLGKGQGMFTSEMFGLGVSELLNYEEPVLSFGATYKRLEDYFAVFILEFEKLLRQLDFDTAKIQLETELLGNFNFFWKSKKSCNASFDENDKMIETEEWFFGFGNRSKWGILINDLLNEEIFNINNFSYPVTV